MIKTWIQFSLHDAIGIISILCVSACAEQHTITIQNPADVPVSRIEAVSLETLGLTGISMKHCIAVQDQQGSSIPSQLIDLDADGVADELALQVSIPARTTALFQYAVTESLPAESPDSRTYCRFVPERIDDFAWENDNVAFRVYGPECQRMKEQGIPGGLISSGIDCWLKRVSYPIIDKWYGKSKTGGSYHTDDGEGLDNFHVGLGRGCGGSAIRSQGGFIYSKNFSEWEVIANGPLRSIFRLQYDPVLVNGAPVAETKTFTIDLGDNYFRCDVQFTSEMVIDTLAIGITLHENLGTTAGSPEGWISYWEPLEDSEIGMAAWTGLGAILGFEKIYYTEKELNHIWLYATPENNMCTYYAGFGWKKAGQFVSEDSWINYVKEQVQKANNPFIVSVQ